MPRTRHFGSIDQPWPWLLALSLLAISTGDADGLIDVGRMDVPSRIDEIVIVDERGYASGRNLGDVWIFDTARPTQPSLLGVLETPGTAWHAAVADGIAYVADGEAGLQIFDVSDPAAPRFVGAFDSLFEAHRVTVSSSRAFLILRGPNAFDSDYMRVVDLTDPTVPVPRGWMVVGGPFAGDAYDVEAVDDELVYLANHEGFHVIDVSDPAAPSIAKTVLSDQTFSIELADGVAYLDVSRELRTFDISDPANPREITDSGAGSPGPAAEKVVVQGDRAVAIRSGLVVLDVSDPANPAELGSFGPGASSVAMLGSFAYAGGRTSAGDPALRVIDISQPTLPSEVETLSTGSSARHVAVSGELAYVAFDASGLAIFDVANPAMPEELGLLDLPGSTQSVITAGDRAYLASAGAGLRIIDISDPLLPQELGFLDTPGTATSVAIDPERSIAYVADGVEGVRVVDVSNPLLPIEISHHVVGPPWAPFYVLRATVVGDVLYVVLAGHGLLAMDVSNPAMPVERGTRPLPGLRDFFALDGLGYAAGDAMSVVDLSDPDVLPIVGAAACRCSLRRITVERGFAYANSPEDATWIFDVSIPSQPRDVGAVSQGGLGGVDAAAGHLYIANERHGVAIIELGAEYLPEPSAPLLAATALVMMGSIRRHRSAHVDYSRPSLRR